MRQKIKIFKFEKIAIKNYIWATGIAVGWAHPKVLAKLKVFSMLPFEILSQKSPPH